MYVVVDVTVVTLGMVDTTEVIMYSVCVHGDRASRDVVVCMLTRAVAVAVDVVVWNGVRTEVCHSVYVNV